MQQNDYDVSLACLSPASVSPAKYLSTHLHCSISLSSDAISVGDISIGVLSNECLLRCHELALHAAMATGIGSLVAKFWGRGLPSQKRFSVVFLMKAQMLLCSILIARHCSIEWSQQIRSRTHGFYPELSLNESCSKQRATQACTAPHSVLANEICSI